MNELSKDFDLFSFEHCKKQVLWLYDLNPQIQLDFMTEMKLSQCEKCKPGRFVG